MSYLKPDLVAPRRQTLLRKFPGNLREEKLDAFLFLIWESLKANLADPIQIVETDCHRDVSVLGCVRFSVTKQTGEVKVLELREFDGEIAFVPADSATAIDLPIKLTGFWLDAYLVPWQRQMAGCLIDHYRPGPQSWLSAMKKEILRAVRLSTHWRRLRHAIRNALCLDRELLNWFRHGRHRNYRRYVSDRQYNGALSNRRHYEQLAKENPNLIWLYNFAVEQGVKLEEADAVASLKSAVLAGKGVTDAGWRYLTRSHRNQFQHLIDWIGPDEDTDGRWVELMYWLKAIRILDRRTPIHPEVMRVFFHDSFDDDAQEGTIKFRSIWLKAGIVRSILSEAERRQATGSLQSFVEGDLVEVMAWLEYASPALDSNQIKQGWKYLAKQAVQWRVEMEAKNELQFCGWECLLPDTVIGQWTVKPIADAWQLRQEALTMRHCCDRYFERCFDNEYRIYSVRNVKGRRVATIGLEFVPEQRLWKSFSIRGFANTPAPASMAGLDKAVEQRYTDLYRLLGQETPSEYNYKVEQQLKLQALESEGEEDNDHEEEDEPIGNECPICGASLSEGDCGHDVAVYDVTFGELESGALYDDFWDIHESIEDGIRQAIKTGQWSFEADEVIRSILNEVPTGGTDSKIDQIILNHDSDIQSLLSERLDACTDVIRTEWEFDAKRPGGCSWYVGYWAGDAEAVVAWLRREFAESVISSNERILAVDLYQKRIE